MEFETLGQKNDSTLGQIKIKNVTAEIKQFRNFWERESYSCNIDVTLDTLTHYRFWTQKED